MLAYQVIFVCRILSVFPEHRNVIKLMDIVLLIKLNRAIYDWYSFLLNCLETDKNYAAFKLKSTRLNSIFDVDNEIELIVLRRVELGFFKCFVFCRRFLLGLFSTLPST